MRPSIVASRTPKHWAAEPDGFDVPDSMYDLVGYFVGLKHVDRTDASIDRTGGVEEGCLDDPVESIGADAYAVSKMSTSYPRTADSCSPAV
jgi:hypothetical protein